MADLGDDASIVGLNGMQLVIFAGNIIAFEPGGVGPCEQIRVTVFPDGGMNRVRVFAAP